MTLLASRMGAAIAATVQAATISSPVTPSELQQLWTDISQDIIDEFNTNAVVNPTSMLDSLSGAVTGTGDIT